MSENQIYKDAFREFFYLCMWILAARYTLGAALLVMVAVGIGYAFCGKVGKAISINAMLMFMVILNPFILPKAGILYTLGLRIGPLLIGLVLVLRGLSSRNGRLLPMGVMLAFILIAGISSSTGWSPRVSYMKLANFTVFFLGIWLGTKLLPKDVGGVQTLRATFLALSVFLILGSLALIPFPGISTLGGIIARRVVGADISLVNQVLVDMAGQSLLCGVTFHSQALAPLSVCASAWTLCDMLFVEGRVRWPHLIMLFCALPVLFMTRSRVALLGGFSAFLLIYLYLPRHISLNSFIKKRLGQILLAAAVFLVLLVVAAEMHSNAISKWLRKTDDVQHDDRSLSDAVTSSRQGLIEMCMDDFRRNPMFGMGFQVAFYTESRLQGQEGLIFSSPVEKGVLPVMVLGETGIVGVFVFIVFLVTFVYAGTKRKLFISISLMGVFCAVNMGEATFFSPGGTGGIEWMICIVGGYTLDVCLVRNNPFYYCRTGMIGWMKYELR